jgi:hypothetical protein
VRQAGKMCEATIDRGMMGWRFQEGADRIVADRAV